VPTRAARWRAAIEARDATDGSPRGQWHHATVNLGDAVVLSTFHATAPGSCGVPWLRRETPPE